MSSTESVEGEAILRNPLEDEQGLSVGDNQKIVRLRRRSMSARDAKTKRRESLDELRAEARSDGDVYRPDYAYDVRNMALEIGEGIVGKTTDMVLKRSYVSNKSGQEVQAVKDAAAQGVHTNFGT